ncbi:GTPase HflX [candidate division WOR-3 bacterium]|uniref:GTPase HflX n=1 Tax=candidate division WOR-3 bacterium TaxID=2052148 RepID=A0A9D5K998_UNCW3|nr:GTPase HflX [candidate division WOR-3 bacterium]MBD3364726.1 GTPase HflX [candidate division WOR-3 bacterium]
MYSREEKETERVLLVAVASSNRKRWEAIDSLEELAALAETAGGEVVEKILQIRQKPDSRSFVGKGKLDYLKAICAQLGIDLVVFDNPLTPTQLRCIEEALKRRTIDRTALILDIFALHARSAEAKTQVELAQLEYQYTKLTGWGKYMSRLGGRSGALGGRAVGIGTRGPGETQLEVDRRRIQERINRLKKELGHIERERATQRKRRKSILTVTMAGYTNAGKSTLLNAMTDEHTHVSSRLFATLDSASRSTQLADNIPMVLTDTVGFIKRLPAQLVASFRATLAEIATANVILHVVDAADRHLAEKIAVVRRSLERLGADKIPTLLVLNKSDLIYDDAVRERLSKRYEGACFCSALQRRGLAMLRQRIRELASEIFTELEVTIPHTAPQWEHLFYESGDVLERTEKDDSVTLRIRGYRSLLEGLSKEFRSLQMNADK